MKYSMEMFDFNYFSKAIENPYVVENKLKDILRKINFVEQFQIHSKIDKDGLYSFEKDKFIVNLTLINSLYIIHTLSESEKIETIIDSYIPKKYDWVLNVTINEK